ncbi:hypothetical protein ACJMK2_016630, partial [Sinanodonta woodiana]
NPLQECHVQNENENNVTDGDLEVCNMVDIYLDFVRVKLNKYSVNVHRSTRLSS